MGLLEKNVGFFKIYFSSFWDFESNPNVMSAPSEKKIRKKISNKKIAFKNLTVEKNVVSKRIAFRLFAAWFFTMLGLATLSNYNAMIPGGRFLLNFQLYTGWILLIGFAGMVWLWRQVASAKESQWDISPWTARICFWLIIGLAIYIRMFDIETPAPDWWDDHFIHTSDIRNVLDFKWYPIFFPSGARESLFPYLTAFLWTFSSKTTGIEIMQFSNMIIDVTAIWIFYLLGKEIGGRRMGVFFLGMGAICKIMIEVTKNQMGCDTCVLGGALALLFLLRLVKKPDFLHFVEWGFAVGFGGYTYVPLRSWLPVMLGGVFLWVWHNRPDKRFDIFRLILGPGLLTAWAFLFLYKNTNFGLGGVLTNPATIIFGVGLLMFSYVKIFLTEHKTGFSQLFMWATAVIVIALVMTPAYLYPFYGSHVSSYSLFNKDMSSFKAAWDQFAGNTNQAISLFFGSSGTLIGVPWAGDAVYDFFLTACSLLGMAYFLARPNWIPAMAIILFFISSLAGTMSQAPHTQRYVACDTPLLLMSAYGLNRFWVAVLQYQNSKSIKVLLAVGVITFISWQFYQNINLYKVWMSHRCPTPLIYDQIVKELPNHRIYVKHLINDHFDNTGLDILADGKPIYVMQDSNEIDLEPNDSKKDLALMVSGEDVITQKRIEKEFPGIPWSKQLMFLQDPKAVPFLYWMEVPFDRIKKNENDLFRVREVSVWDWTRRCYRNYGLGRGLIRYEDKVKHWNDPIELPNADNAYANIKISGPWNLKISGDYVFSFQTGDILWFFLDGKKIMTKEHNEEDNNKRVYKKYLTVGVHQVEIINYSINAKHVPVINVLMPGSSEMIPLDDLALNDRPENLSPNVSQNK